MALVWHQKILRGLQEDLYVIQVLLFHGIRELLYENQETLHGIQESSYGIRKGNEPAITNPGSIFWIILIS